MNGNFKLKNMATWSTIGSVTDGNINAILDPAKTEQPRPSVPINALPRYKTTSQWFWALLTVFGLFLLATGGWKAQRMLVCNDWPIVHGIVLESELKRGHLREGSLKYRYHLVYTYMVGDQEYRNQRISFDGTVPGTPQTRLLPRRYPAGTAVTVHYNSTNPKLAVIETHTSLNGYKPLAAGVVLSLLGMGGLYRRWPLQTDYLFRERDQDEPLTKTKIFLGTLGILVCLGIVWIWWELIKMYAGR